MREKRARTSSPSPALFSGADAILSKEPAPGPAAPAPSSLPGSGTGTMRQAFGPAFGPAWPPARVEAPLAGPAPASGPERTTPAPASGTGITKQTLRNAWRLATEEVPHAELVPAAWLGAMKFLPRTTAFKMISELMKDNKICRDCRELYAYQVVQVKGCSTAPILFFETGHFKAVKEVKKGVFKIYFNGCRDTDPSLADCHSPSAAAENPVPPSQSESSPHQGGDVEEPN